uniref:AlNc14C103G6131 protein n=1 Tax=Albugo laibachii Nc14 TaxID=890382 RepID=F0WHS4_9STRA|nr:AlNc14C103G6131 [Albugo laibachii Nc14]|eukprot:CCA20799.1 AlNc14C103G6131 [Albugo laibachii Nc14]
MKQLYLIMCLGIRVLGHSSIEEQRENVPLVIRPLASKLEGERSFNQIKYVNSLQELLEAMEKFTEVGTRLILEMPDEFLHSAIEASDFWKKVKELSIKPHSIQVFLKARSSHFLGGPLHYTVAFYSHEAWKDFYGSTGTSYEAFDYFTEGFPGKRFYIDFESSIKKNRALMDMVELIEPIQKKKLCRSFALQHSPRSTHETNPRAGTEDCRLEENPDCTVRAEGKSTNFVPLSKPELNQEFQVYRIRDELDENL